MYGMDFGTPGSAGKKKEMVTVLIVAAVVVVALAVYFVFRKPVLPDEDLKNIGETIIDPAEKVGQTNPFDKKTNPFSDYQNPFEE